MKRGDLDADPDVEWARAEFDRMLARQRENEHRWAPDVVCEPCKTGTPSPSTCVKPCSTDHRRSA